ncbi:MAG: hypothetical protein JO053_12160 [Acidobacteria bacterium]|nr:hypothetical protein [Acidobacteriota bacterium]
MSQPPEEIELAKKRRVLDRLAERLVNAEEEMTDLRDALEQFEARYTMQVGRLYAEFDEIEALIAEEEVKLVPDDEEIKKKAEELRRRAEESAARAEEAAALEPHSKPNDEAKKAYHDLARIIHPDLALESDEKDRRHALMAELNAAYSSGDHAKLDKLAADLKHSPDLVPGDTVGDELVRVIRQLHQVRRRLQELALERASAENSERFDLMKKVEAESAEGRDLLCQMAARTNVHIKKSERRLANLRAVNQAQEEYVKEKYGMDIEDFRPS